MFFSQHYQLHKQCYPGSRNQSEGTTVIRHMYFDDLSPLDVGGNVDDLEGCFDLSNSISVSLVAGQNCITTNVNEVWNESAVKLTPNPAQDFLDIDITAIAEHDIEVILRDYLGKTIYAEAVNSTTIRLNISNLSAGVYLIELKGKNQHLTKPFIKSND